MLVTLMTSRSLQISKRVIELKVNLRKIVEEIRAYKGFTRKSHIWDLARIFNVKCKFDDAGWFAVGNQKIVASTDGITEDLMKADPWLAGSLSVLVNVNDVVAKGAKPIGYMANISSSSPATRKKIIQGVKYGVDKYQLKTMKFHTNPDSSYTSIDASVLGVAKRVIPSSNAKPGDSLVVSTDLNGSFGKRGWVRFFDSTTKKPKRYIRKHVEAMIKIADRKLAHASRDVSAPGIVGSIAMLCESSSVGARVRVTDIPKPEGIDISKWIISYPACSFIISTDKPDTCVNIFREHGFEASSVGEVTEDKKIILSSSEESEIFIDFKKESVFGVKRKK
jgi:selenophosphate synthetase-related protein